MEEKMITIPRWIVENAQNALRLNYNITAANNSESCLRRQTAQSYNFLSLFLSKEKPTDEEIRKITVDYIDGRIKQFNQHYKFLAL